MFLSCLRVFKAFVFFHKNSPKLHAYLLPILSLNFYGHKIQINFTNEQTTVY